MNKGPSQTYSYVLGHSEQEPKRLSRQSVAFAPFTRQLLQEAGVSPGMRVLDFGCGSGDVTILVAELVGPGGQVLGTDRAAAAIEWARARAQASGASNVEFAEGDPTAMDFGEPFDAVVGRLLLMYYPDPVEAVRKLAAHVKPGGLVVFQEFDEANCRSFPTAPVFDRAASWIRRTLQASGAHPQMGLRLYRTYLASGLPGPSLRMDALIGGGPECPAYDLVAEVV